jgi:RES domain-containing protein
LTPPPAPFAGRAWRGHDPRWAHDPLSGQGAAITGGRLNRPGEPTLYLALAPETAIREVQAGFPHRFQPLTLCAYEVRASRIADLRNDAVMTGLGFDPGAPACDWRLDTAEGREPPSWGLADALRSAGAQGVLIPSHALGAAPHDLDLVLWSWNAPDGAEVEVIDDHRRLPPPPSDRPGNA